MKKTNESYSDIPQVLRDYLNFMTVIKGKSANTVKEYYYDLRLFLRFIQCKFLNQFCDDFNTVDITNFDSGILQQITLSDLYEFMAYINNRRSDNDNYRARKVASIKSFFNYLSVKANLITDNPALHLDTPKIKRRMPRYLSLEQSADLLKAIDGKFKQRDFAIFVIFLTCGLRLSELVGINLRDIDFEKQTLRVIGKGNKERILFLNDLCMNAIRSYLEVRPTEGVAYDDRNALFLSAQRRRISNRAVEINVKKYFQAAGIDPERYSPHKLRHTAATIMYKEGNVDIRTLQELLGHASLSTTQLYTHIKNEDLKQAADNNPLGKMNLDN
ncbi:MAG: tyrosine recombinase XerC [Ruminococcaceae bacterium]|nr:tyrosine recombinase XerC [Oscillospiraceae bacterium]